MRSEERFGRLVFSPHSPLLTPHSDFNISARPRRLDGVAQHVQDQLAQLPRVAVDHRLAGRRLPAQLDAGVLALRPQ